MARLTSTACCLRALIRCTSTLVLAFSVQSASAFSFTEDAQKDAAEDAARTAAASAGLAALPQPCLDELKRRKIMIVMGERSGEGITADQARYSPHLNAIHTRLQKLGIRTLTQQEIRAQVAQAEVDAYFRNDPDAALAASKKLGAQLIMRGLIEARSGMNPVLHIPEVSVSIDYALLTSGGTRLSDASASAESYSGSDTLAMARTLIEEQADGVVNRLLGGYCAARPAADEKKGSRKGK